MVPPLAEIPPEKFLYSEASLDAVVAVTPCRGEVRGKKALIGMLLLYINGDRECVGQVRFDTMLPKMDVLHCNMCLGRCDSDDETVLLVACWPPPRNLPGITYERLPMEATLQWYFDVDEHFVRVRDDVLPYASVDDWGDD